MFITNCGDAEMGGVHMYTYTGTLRYFITGNGRYRLTIELDTDFGDYYRNFIPKWKVARSPKYKPHITLVRTGKEYPTNLEMWGKHEGESIEFQYTPYIYEDETYFWMSAWSDQAVEIRKALGLPPFRFIDSKSYHITIANKKF